MPTEGKPKRYVGVLNSPFVIWLLSSVVVGLFTFLYNENSRQRSEKQARDAQATEIFFEAHFRIRQMQRVLANFERDDASTDALQQMVAGGKLAGIVSFPRDSDFEITIGSGGYGNRHLPAGRGFQNDSFSGYSLLDLWYRYFELTCERRPSEEEIERLSRLLDELDASLDGDLGDLQGTFQGVKDKWVPAMKAFPMFLSSGPQIDMPSLASACQETPSGG